VLPLDTGLAAARVEEMSDLFPIVSLRAFETASRADRALMAAEVDRICCETGFLAVTDHGVPQPIIDGAWAAARAFFDQAADVKQQARAPYPGYPYGYLDRIRRRLLPRAASPRRPTSRKASMAAHSAGHPALPTRTR
jgi:hypothetical protein